MIEPHFVFAGDAEAALDHYRDALGGEIEIQRFAGSPAEPHMPAGWGDKVLYGTLRSPYGPLHAMDASPERVGEKGGAVMFGLTTTSEAETDALYAKLLDGGSVLMPLEKTFWSPKFGMVSDKFGIRWMISLQGA